MVVTTARNSVHRNGYQCRYGRSWGDELWSARAYSSALIVCRSAADGVYVFFFNVPHRALHHAHRLCYVLLRIICYCSVYKFYCYVLVSIASISISLLKYVWHFHPRLKLAAALRECLPCCWSFLPSLAGNCMFPDTPQHLVWWPVGRCASLCWSFSNG